MGSAGIISAGKMGSAGIISAGKMGSGGIISAGISGKSVEKTSRIWADVPRLSFKSLK